VRLAEGSFDREVRTGGAIWKHHERTNRRESLVHT
jgi:hypothetical protein